ncbi:MAG: hypothetical protein IPM24_28300 [Bryobacterales bacterium]|jgi:hypothetical protein|nr:hypothetical protein [Bryobacterales bacterium]
MKAVCTVLALSLLLAGCARAPKLAPEVIADQVAKLPESPDDAAWNRASEHLAKMIPQDLVEPRLLTPSTPEVRVRALTDGARVAFRLTWPDVARDDRPGPARMIDACAVQIPEKLAPEPPDPQMGGEGKTVQVTYWRADWQASVDGRGDTIRDLYPNASIDHYPFEAQSLEKGSAAQQEMQKLYAPARALGNVRSGPREKPVEDLIAAGPGTLSPGPSLDAQGKGSYGKEGWSVVISRRLPEGLNPGQRTQIAFAVWQGSEQESGARKMRTGWIPLMRRGE